MEMTELERHRLDVAILIDSRVLSLISLALLVVVSLHHHARTVKTPPAPLPVGSDPAPDGSATSIQRPIPFQLSLPYLGSLLPCDDRMEPWLTHVPQGSARAFSEPCRPLFYCSSRKRIYKSFRYVRGKWANTRFPRICACLCNSATSFPNWLRDLCVTCLDGITLEVSRNRLFRFSHTGLHENKLGLNPPRMHRMCPRGLSTTLPDAGPLWIP
ncbi:hypothetical protein AG1IA_03424 [Rhizoctonia solani AG-1 IA]|uniref:Uncharacterized protein n=1 Tax=Thanatephorus cucumeris (strain AG1-IA) TaxID=983506 RepID=L8X1Q1_THACA|nr:hypothetical protein AG1IA_03424 [Rhizoctonia solani AG-1 IA]